MYISDVHKQNYAQQGGVLYEPQITYQLTWFRK